MCSKNDIKIAIYLIIHNQKWPILNHVSGSCFQLHFPVIGGGALKIYRQRDISLDNPLRCESKIIIHFPAIKLTMM